MSIYVTPEDVRVWFGWIATNREAVSINKH